MKFYAALILLFSLVLAVPAYSQTDAVMDSQESTVAFREQQEVLVMMADTAKPVTKPSSDSIFTKAKPKHDPRIATRRSLIFPGLGQIYNKEYWKLPLVYGALSIPTITFIYNNTWYHRTKFAYETKFAFEQQYGTSPPPGTDSTEINKINPKLLHLSTGSLQSYRNIFRRDRDYSVLWFIIVWGLNVADATVFAHLKGFDVSDNLAVRIKPNINPISKNNEVKLSLSFKKPTTKLIDIK